ncbi:C-C chemokine receptor type 8-like [Myxocyprinus asiaticus]|uniref:C-C chemokine receptor type 8-like n=1 Tax=Myxocyprinus asiaticus TaxID=70543 RepID=UPI002223A865|nr:C-C chemokine receptor type 8-like [Myxocyprinus asiaticus]
MNNSIGNITSSEVPSTNHTTKDILILESLRIGVASFNLIIGIPTHSFVLWLIATGRGSGIASEFSILNLTICEKLFSLNSLVFLLSKMFPSLLTLQRFLLGLGITGRPLFHCLICVERYLAVVHPVTFLKFKPLRYKMVCSIAIWLISFGSCLVCMITFLLSNMRAFAWFFSLQFILFLSIQLFCLSAVLRALKQSGPGERRREREEENHMKRRAFYLILITTLTMVMMFVPLIITGFLTVLQNQAASIIWFISFFCFILAGFLQPVLYLHRTVKLLCLCSP